MLLNDFKNENFPNLELGPPLFYSWDIGIRFELGTDWRKEYVYPNNPYIQGCYKRVIALFEELHSPLDDILIMIDVNDFEKGKNIRSKLKNFPPYVEKPLLYKLNHQKMPYIFSEDDEDGAYKTHRFTLKCKTSDFKYIPLLKAICNQDMGIKPSMFHRVYFININKKTIFHVYDDRGCDLLATSPETIKDVYHKYNDWILDYDRHEIDKVFNNGFPYSTIECFK
ncbi:DUF3885 domain-containing protein [Bacillus salipaludis]|uniref:DUF3885 domain-containing protein n=1 Tax=Bacillus salipaludis TaxID=2547811 RepID=A0A4R5VSJ2_9BACI|nr:DUF3885 domain-containing protein [Bacillus salipaludis]TDK61748.1 DUF3885 domain-containing protein [Bacillus salipaludis]